MIISAFNEEKRIRRALKDYSRLLQLFGKDITIIIMSESTDKTNSIVSSYSKKYKNIRLIKNAERLGKGGAILKTFQILCKTCSPKDIIGFVDSDESVPSSEVARLIKTLKVRRIDGIIGSRYLPGSKIIGKMPETRVIASRAYNILVKLLFALPYSDTQCAAKFFRADAVCALIGRIVLYHTTIDVDILYKMKLDKRKVIEVPIIYKVVPGGIKPRILTIFMTTVGLRLSHTRTWKYIPDKIKYGLYKKLSKIR
jgi:glycosyltransferase involved in cell wall biosynthesis